MEFGGALMTCATITLYYEMAAIIFLFYDPHIDICINVLFLFLIYVIPIVVLLSSSQITKITLWLLVNNNISTFCW